MTLLTKFEIFTRWVESYQINISQSLYRLVSILLLIAFRWDFYLLTHHKLCIRTLTCSQVHFIILKHLTLLFKRLCKVLLWHISMLCKTQHLSIYRLVHTLCVNLRLLVFKYSARSLFHRVQLSHKFSIFNLWYWFTYFLLRFSNLNFNIFSWNLKIFL